MTNNNEIQALVQLLDDPDENIYQAVSEKLFSLDTRALTYLNPIIEGHANSEIELFRAKTIVERINSTPIINSFKKWHSEVVPNLFEGALLLNKYVNGYYDGETLIRAEFDEIQKMIWVELNSYLTPLEKLKIISSVIFKIKKINAQIVDYGNENEFVLSSALIERQGNNYSLSAVYLSLCQIFELPVYALRFPKHIILAYYDEQSFTELNTQNNFYNISFFIDPSFGNFLNHENISIYFDRIGVAIKPIYFEFLNAQQLINISIEELGKCHDQELKNRMQVLHNALINK